MNRATSLMVRLSRRSWWAARYRDGRELYEWATLVNTVLTPFGHGSTSRWETVPKAGLISLRLLCPNGQVGQVDSREDGKFFQLKTGGVIAGRGQYCTAHLIGVVYHANGDCRGFAWDTRQWSMRFFEDNVRAMSLYKIGPLSLEVQGLRL